MLALALYVYDNVFYQKHVIKPCINYRFGASNRDPLHLVERDLVVRCGRRAWSGADFRALYHAGWQAGDRRRGWLICRAGQLIEANQRFPATLPLMMKMFGLCFPPRKT
jgi:hypothetical protein